MSFVFGIVDWDVVDCCECCVIWIIVWNESFKIEVWVKLGELVVGILVEGVGWVYYKWWLSVVWFDIDDWIVDWCGSSSVRLISRWGEWW